MENLSDSVFGHRNRNPKKRKKIERRLVPLEKLPGLSVDESKTGPVLYSSIAGRSASFEGNKSQKEVPYVPDSELEETVFGYETEIPKRELSKRGIFVRKEIKSEERRRKYDNKLFEQDSYCENNSGCNSVRKNDYDSEEDIGESLDEAPFDDSCIRNWKL